MQQGTTLEKNLAELAPGAKVLPFRDYTSAWLALRQGRADAFTGSYDMGAYLYSCIREDGERK